MCEHRDSGEIMFFPFTGYNLGMCGITSVRSHPIWAKEVTTYLRAITDVFQDIFYNIYICIYIHKPTRFM